MARYGRLQLNNHPVHGLVLQAIDPAVLEEVLRSKKVSPLLGARVDETTVVVHPSERGHLKQALVKLGWPAEDVAGYVDGERHAIGLQAEAWQPRPYQTEAAEGFWHGGSGVVVLPCGSGKTIVGALAMALAQATTLILVTNTVAARQWRDELLRRTTLDRRRDRRVLRRAQGDPARHHRDLPGDDDEAPGHLPAPRGVRLPRLGADHLRRGAPAARADLPVHRRHPVTSPARAHRHARPRGRPRGRRVLAHRPQALRRALEGHREPGLHRAGRLHRGARDPARRRPDDVRDGRAGGPLPAVGLRAGEDPHHRGDRRRATPTTASS